MRCENVFTFVEGIIKKTAKVLSEYSFISFYILKHVSIFKSQYNRTVDKSFIDYELQQKDQYGKQRSVYSIVN